VTYPPVRIWQDAYGNAPQHLLQGEALPPQTGERRRDTHHLPLHLSRIECFEGHSYALCCCGSISLAMSSAADAFRWSCPLEQAEAENARNWQRFHDTRRAFGR
jgi:hypothetical protein